MKREIAVATAQVAKEEKIDLAGLLAFVEVESGGEPFNTADHSWPIFLFERHKFWKNLPPNKRDAAARNGLAHSDWRPNSQYKDQNTPAKRVALLKRAIAFDEKAALMSASWGLGQVMGEHYDDLGYMTVQSFVQDSRTITGQVRMIVKFLKKNNLLRHLQAKNWQALAKGYNGAGYKTNKYDTKLAAAYAKWAKEVSALEQEAKRTPNPSLTASTKAAESQTQAGNTRMTESVATTGAAGTIAVGGGALVMAPNWIVPVLILLAGTILVLTFFILHQRRKAAEQTAVAAAAVSVMLDEGNSNGYQPG